MQIPKTIRFNSDGNSTAAPQPESSAVEAPVSPSPTPDAQAEGSAPSFLAGEEYASLRQKFSSAEALAKSYQELEKRLSGQTQEAPPATTQGIDLDTYEQEYQAKGQLSGESYAKLQQQGISRETVEQYILGRQALANQQMAEVLNASGVGTVERYQEISAWAQKNLPADELQAYNAAVSGKDLGATKAAVAGLNARYSQANGRGPSLLQGKLAQGPAVQPYQSNEQVTADMRNPKYKTDPAYRAEVERRLAVSDVLNNGKITR